MNFLTRTTYGIARAENAYGWFVPGYSKLFRPKLIKTIIKGIGITKTIIKCISKEPSEVFGKALGKSVIRLSLTGVRGKLYNIYEFTGKLNESHLRTPIRSWFNKKERLKITIVFHHANKAGKHLDIHFSNGVSFIMRVDGKPVNSQLKYVKGKLTQSSKNSLIKHIRQEILNNSRVPQNLDHNPFEAQMTWTINSGPNGYGSGPIREVIGTMDADVYKLGDETGKTAEIYCPQLYKHGGMYIHKLYPGDDKKTPIAIWGTLKPEVPNFKDRLNLTMIAAEDLDKFKNKTDISTTTRKYDGASAYINVTKKGTTLWSPRISKETGRRIEYTQKFTKLASITSNDTIKGMGEALFKRKYLKIIPGPYLSSTEIGGILNSNKLVPSNVIPEFRIYRIDKFGNLDTYDLPFFDNRVYQTILSDKMPSVIKVVQLCKPVFHSNWEGLVAVPKGESVNNGYKIKQWGDSFDWIVTRNELNLSDKGNIAGTISFKSLESGKNFQLGPGQLGSNNECLLLLQNGDDIVGRVAKVHGRIGHEGRAAKFIEWHQDKGDG